MSANDSKLSETIGKNEGRAHWSAWLIVVGLVIEIVLAIVFPHGASWIETWSPVIATALIALGVYGEIHFSGKAAEAHKALQIETEQRLTEALNRAARAEESLAHLRRPRREIFKERGAAVTESLKPFAGTVFDTAMGPADQDVGDCLWDLEPLLHNAGWNQVNWKWPDGQESGVRRGAFSGRKTIATEQAVSNISIQIHPTEEDAFGLAADALVDALNSIGVEAKRDAFNIHNGNANALHILVGPKR